jgi:polyhydroxyalkanoate synthesis repressor PhaR
MSDARIIKRYANRKLYDTQHSRYVTLDQIAEMIRHGDDVKIIDNKTKDDLTSVTLAQIIFEEEKKQKSFLSLQTMRNIIQSGGESISQFVTEAQKKMTKMLPRKGREGEDSAPAEATTLQEHEEPGPGEEETYAGRRRPEPLRNLREFREWLVNSQRTLDDWQKRVDGRIRHVVEGISPFASLQKEVQGLASRIAQLESRLGEFVHHEHPDDELPSEADEEPKD